jgi:hypothetical protein
VRRQARKIQQILDLAAQKGETLYLEYFQAAPIPYRPVWGQGFVRYHIKWGAISLENYTTYASTTHLWVTVTIRIAPYNEGQLQYALDGTGGIWEDDLFSEYRPRGTAVLPAMTNYFTNPLFSYDYAGNWYTHWTKGSDLDYWQNKLPEYILYGEASCGLVRTGPTNKLLIESLTAANTNTHAFSCYARRKDGGTIDATVLKLFYAAALATTYTALEDGWYRLTATAAGIASAQSAGVSVEVSDIDLFVTAFQMEEAGVPTPFCYGDQVGCTWAGTQHFTASSRAAGSLANYPQHFFKTGRLDQGTIRMALRWFYPSTFGTDVYLIDCITWSVYYSQADDKIYFTDGTNTISTAALSFAAGDLVVIHIVFGPGTMKIYIDGAEAATGSTYASIASTTKMYFGSDSSPANHGCMTWLDLTMWTEVVTADEISADYVDVITHISGGDGYGQRLSAIPWYWTEDGGVLDLYCDSSHLDTMAAGGIDGDVPARTVLVLSNNSVNRSMLLGLNWHNQPVYIRDAFADVGQTTVAAGALGGKVEDTVVNTSEVTGGVVADYLDIYNNRKAYYGKQAYIVVSLSDGGADLLLQMRLWFSSPTFVISGEWQPVATDGTRRTFLVGPVAIPDGLDQNYPYAGYAKSGWQSWLNFLLYFKRSTGTGTVYHDFSRALVGEVAYLDVQNASTLMFVVDGEIWLGFASGMASLLEQAPVKGSRIELKPNRYNYLTVLSGDLGGATDHTTYATTIEHVMVAPRWKLL